MTSRTRHFEASDVDPTLAASLDSLDGATNYHDWIVELVRPSLAAPILELGAGHGTFTESFAEIGEVDAVEPGSHASGVLGERFADHAAVSVIEGFVTDLPVAERYRSAVAVNVLEHIEDDAEAVAAIHERLVPGSRMTLWVPAFELLYSPFDHELGHHRRYRRPQLEQIVRDAGFESIESRYVNLPGWFSWLVVTRLLRQRPTAGPLLRVFDRVIVPITRAVEARVRVPFGQSILLVATKPTTPR